MKSPVRIFCLFILFHLLEVGLMAAKPDKPLNVEIGMYVLDLAKLDMKENQFFADFYIWYKWPIASGLPWTPENIEFMNGNIELATKLSTDTISDGRLYASQRIKGTFRGKFNLHLYPFDTQVLPIVIEDSAYNKDKLILSVDNLNPEINKWIESSVQVPDWEISGARIVSDIHDYQTDFGYQTPEDLDKNTHYSRFTYQIKLKRFFVPHLIKFIIPLIVIAGMAYLVFFINAKEFEAQCGICVTALLSAVALHMSQADALPAVGYLVIADKIFILFYVVIFSALVQTVIVNNYAKTGNKELAGKIDYLFRIVYPLCLIFGGILIGIV